jgi:surface antigen
MRLFACCVICLASFALVAPGAAIAEKPAHAGGPKAGKEQGGGKPGKSSKPSKVKLSWKTGGPPPWAPAHGYRRGGNDYVGLLAVPPLDLPTGRCNSAAIGQLLGGAAGAALGSQVGQGSGRIAAVIGGTIAGFMVGGEIGRAMDSADRLCADQVFEHGASAQEIQWQDAGSGRRYRMTPQDAYRSPTGRFCRDFTMMADIGGRASEVVGMACRPADGSWKVEG